MGGEDKGAREWEVLGGAKRIGDIAQGRVVKGFVCYC